MEGKQAAAKEGLLQTSFTHGLEKQEGEGGSPSVPLLFRPLMQKVLDKGVVT